MEKLQFNSVPTWDDVIENRDTINELIDEIQRLRKAVEFLSLYVPEPNQVEDKINEILAPRILADKILNNEDLAYN